MTACIQETKKNAFLKESAGGLMVQKHWFVRADAQCGFRPSMVTVRYLRRGVPYKLVDL